MHNRPMTPIETLQTVPLAITEDGTIRIAGSRVSLESVLYHFKLGAAPEEIAHKFPSLSLADIYAVIAYYLNHRKPVEEYLLQSEAASDSVQSEIEARPGYHTAMTEIRERLLNRWSSSS